MESEIVAGLKNALQRGESLGRAMQTFVNAGYNPQEVKAAGQSFSGVSGIIYPDNKVTVENKKPAENKSSLPVAPEVSRKEIKDKINVEKNKDKSRRALLIVSIVLVSLVFIGVLSFLVYTLST